MPEVTETIERKKLSSLTIKEEPTILDMVVGVDRDNNDSGCLIPVEKLLQQYQDPKTGDVYNSIIPVTVSNTTGAFNIGLEAIAYYAQKALPLSVAFGVILTSLSISLTEKATDLFNSYPSTIHCEPDDDFVTIDGHLCLPLQQTDHELECTPITSRASWNAGGETYSANVIWTIAVADAE